MQLKEFQTAVLKRLSGYLKTLKKEHLEEHQIVQMRRKLGHTAQVEDYCRKAWEKLYQQGQWTEIKNTRAPAPHYVEIKNTLGHPIPNVCLKVPTGGGKTLLGVSAAERIANDYFNTHTGLVLWVVPTDAIYKQTIHNFQNRKHPYRCVLERAAAGRLKILHKNSAFSKHDLQKHLCVMILMLQSANRETKESLKLFQDSGRFLSFFPPTHNYKAHKALLEQFPNLIPENTANKKKERSPFVNVPSSLGNVIRMARPIIILDEGHRAYSNKARNTVQGLNPRFILELSATPNIKQHQSNVLVDVSGAALKQEQMIKLPIHIINSRGANWKKTLSQAYTKLNNLQQQAQQQQKKTNQYIRPIMLIQVERTGKDQRDKDFIHAEDVKEYLKKSGVHENAIKIKVSGRDELKDENLLHPNSQVRFIVTRQALQEGWDCPFAYVLVVLSKSKSKLALTQLVGRILRQPEARATSNEALDSSYVFCCNQKTSEVVTGVQKALQHEGLEDLGEGQIIQVASDNMQLVRSKRRPKNLNIFLPRVLHKYKNTWRPIVYEHDVLKNVDFLNLKYRKKDTFFGTDFITHEHELVDLKSKDLKPQDQMTTTASPSSLDPVGASTSKTPSKPYVESRQALSQWTRQSLSSTYEVIEMDFVHMVRRLSNTIPNSNIAAHILGDTIAAFKARGLSQEQIYRHRESILNSIEDDLLEQIHAQSEQIFTQKLATGQLSFKIFKNKVDLNWELGQEFNFIASRQTPAHQGSYGQGLQMSLFDLYSSHHFNQLEEKVAGYLDEHKAIKWWHRMVAKQDYRLQGWQKNKVYPDFLACVEGSQAQKIAVLETKGQHLIGNDDTLYKKKLFQLLENTARIDVGKLETASTDETQMVFRILMEKSWYEDAAQTLGG